MEYFRRYAWVLAGLSLAALFGGFYAIVMAMNGRFDLAGVDDWHAGRYAHGHGWDLDKAMAGHDPERAAVLLAHQPLGVERGMRAGVGLQLSGHTHGGQVCAPGWGALTTNCDLPASKAKGLHQHRAAGNSSWLHVSGGVGSSPYAPYRFACPPEVTLLTLTSRPNG